MKSPEENRLTPGQGLSSADLLASYCGEAPNQGLLIPREIHEGEGYATLACGGTEVRLSYTILHMLCGQIASGHLGTYQVSDRRETLKGFHAITCEAGLGKCGANNEGQTTAKPLSAPLCSLNPDQPQDSE